MPSERVQRRIDKLLDQAEEAADSRDWTAVIESVAGVLVLDSENADALLFKEMATQTQAAAQVQIEPDTVSSSSIAAEEPTPPAEQPTSFANGRYSVKSQLGEKVFLVHDNTLDRDVAFGLIKAEGLDSDSRQRIIREAQAMGRLGDHPNIMPIHDLGDENGQPYMVQPLMAGGDVGSLIEEAEGGMLQLEDALRISSEILSGLEFAHAQGIIHRDLKPGNIWLTDDGTARIGDFGLALSIDRSRLTQEKTIVGTVCYMPPEQATGGEVTAQADLYSLGAMMYEMVAGRPPFLGDDDIAILGQHINTPPVAPQWYRSEIPAQLNSLIMRLLTKNPAERPDSAADVLAAVKAIDLSSASNLSQGSGASESETGSLDSMAAGVFVGRHAEMDQLKAKLENALSGRGRMLTLVGEPGIGKTRTSLALETYAGLRNAQVLWGGCYEGGGAPPYWPWVQAIRSYVAGRDPDELRREMGSTASVIAEVVDEVKQALPDLQAPPTLDEPESARFRLFNAIANFLKNAGQAKPLVLVLDDLHWADKPSLLLLEFVAKELAASRVLIIGTYRDMELNRRHPLTITLGDLTRDRLFERVLLRGLTKSDVSRFIELAADLTAPDQLVEIVHTQTEGNPLFITETVRLLIQERELTAEKTADRDSWSVRIPEGVREVIGRRLDRLSERCNEVLTIAAIIGREFRFPIVDAMMHDLTEDRLLDVLDEAVDARIIEELPSEIGLYQFTHALMQETLTQELSLTRRVRVHARIAESLEAHSGEEANARADELAGHFAEAGTILGADRFVHYSTLAGESALGNYAYESAFQYLDRAMSQLGEEITSDAHADLAHSRLLAEIATINTTELSQMIPPIYKLFKYYRDHDQPKKAIDVALIDFRYGPFRFPEIEPVLAEALLLAEPDSVEQGRVLARHGFVLFWELGEDERGIAELERAMELAKLHGNAALEMAVHLNSARIGEIDRGTENVFESARQVYELADQIGDKPTQAVVGSTLSATALYLGRMGAAWRYADECNELARNVGSKIVISDSAVMASRVAYSEGRFEDARQWLQVAFRYSTEGNRQRVMSILVDWHASDFEQGFQVTGKLLETTEQLIESDPGWVSLIASTAVHRLSLGIAVPNMDRIVELSEVSFSTKRPKWIEEIALALTSWFLHAGESEGALRFRSLIIEPTTLFTTMPIENHQRRLGDKATGFGEFEVAESHFESALEQCGDSYVVERALTCRQYAQMLIQRGGPGDGERTIVLQDQAIDSARKHHLKTLLERVLGER